MFAALNSFLTRAVSTGYFLNKSLRFRSSASAYLNRTFGTPTNNIKWTWSGWVKRGTLSAAGRLFGVGTDASGINQGSFYFSSNVFVFFQGDGAGSAEIYLATNALYRDPSAWYHITFVYDSASRILLYINGEQVTSFSTATYPSASLASKINANAVAHAIGVLPTSPSNFFDGELAEVNFVDGQALAPTAFGASSIYNQWLPIKYAGTYGTNGFYLPFTNTTSTSTLVADSSGNGNNWTPNNISLTAGSTYDSLTDVPTLTSETVANYAVMNPLDGYQYASSILTMTNGNLTATVGTAASINGVASIVLTSGKWYAEFTVKAFSTGSSLMWFGASDIKGFTGNSSAYNSSGAITFNGSSTSGYATFNVGDVIGCAFDITNNTATYYKNSTQIATGTLGVTTKTYVFWAQSNVVGDSFAANFGQQPFVYTAPSGFLPLNTFNIPAGTVTTSGTFTGNLSTDGPFVFLNGTPTAMTINGNAVTFGTHADKLANGFKVRSSSASYNASGSNTYVATTVGEVFKYEEAQANP
jgi:hypothetical protein